jgi:hypothetical protein
MNIDGPEPAAAARKVVQEQDGPDGTVNDTKADDSRVDGTQVDDTPVDGNQTDGKISAADAARSAENIRIWRSYLPKDCVDTMIKMGWDLSV